MSRRTSVVPAIALVLLGLTTPAAADGSGGRATGTPGAPGLGDPYYPLDGNGGYDVRHYDLDLRYDPATDVLAGVARIEARALQDLSRFHLDLEGLDVRAVVVDGHQAAWDRDGQELRITPRHGLRGGGTFTTVVTYDGVPRTIEDALGVSGFMHTDDGAIVAGQPHGAATWFPANDHPRDAASVSLAATVPEGLEAVSNGALRGQHTHDGWTTWSWHAREPMATYLVTLAIGEYDIREYRESDIRYWDALDPDLFTGDATTGQPSPGQVAEASLARQPEITEFLATVFDRPYPFRTSGGIVDDLPEFQFALETQTRPIYSSVFFTDAAGGDAVVVHELAHQWIGNLLRIDSWQHIWLNEGFATYAEWLWLEREGVSTPQAEFDAVAAAAPPEFWQPTIGDPGAATEDLFHPAVYYRGAMTLHALRTTVGDEVFFEILSEWVDSRAGGTVTTGDFVALAEKLSGQELDGLFQAWLHTPGNPTAPR